MYKNMLFLKKQGFVWGPALYTRIENKYLPNYVSPSKCHYIYSILLKQTRTWWYRLYYTVGRPDFGAKIWNIRSCIYIHTLHWCTQLMPLAHSGCLLGLFLSLKCLAGSGRVLHSGRFDQFDYFQEWLEVIFVITNSLCTKWCIRPLWRSTKRAEATAATVACMVDCAMPSGPPDSKFTCDRPFMFLIRENQWFFS